MCFLSDVLKKAIVVIGALKFVSSEFFLIIFEIRFVYDLTVESECVLVIGDGIARQTNHTFQDISRTLFFSNDNIKPLNLSFFDNN